MKRMFCLLLSLTLLLSACGTGPAKTETGAAEPETTTAAENEVIAVTEPSSNLEKPKDFGLVYVPAYGFNP